MTASHSLLRRFVDFCTARRLFSKNQRLLIAVSGGVDSMVLLDLLRKARKEWNLDLAVVHVNHQLRGEDSLGDEDFVRESADHYRLPFYCKRVDTLGLKHTMGVSKQVAARHARYEYFEEVRHSLDFAGVVTAHQADDNAETVLLNAIRGSGVRGLAGIPVVRKPGNIIRPLLFASRKDILTYADNHGICFREDSSNATEVYTRNYLRHSVVPLLADVIGPDPAGALNRFSDAARRLGIQLDTLVDGVLPSAVKFGDGGCEIDLTFFLNEPRFVKEEILLRVFRHLAIEPRIVRIDDVTSLSMKQTGHRVDLGEGWKAYKTRDRVCFTRRPVDESFCFNVAPGQSYTVDNFALSLSEPGPVPSSFSDDTSVEYIDGDKIREPMTVRSWKTGDWFVPFGMKGRKKLSDYLNEVKVASSDKRCVPVLSSGEDIVWVCGRRLDDRFRITRSTQHAIKLSFHHTTHTLR